MGYCIENIENSASSKTSCIRKIQNQKENQYDRKKNPFNGREKSCFHPERAVSWHAVHSHLVPGLLVIHSKVA